MARLDPGRPRGGLFRGRLMLTLLDDVAYHGLLRRPQAVLLRHLMDSGRSVTRADLADALWAHHEDGGAGDGTIHSFLNQLRPKLRPGFRIENEAGRGWRLVVDREALERALVRQVADMLSDSRGDRFLNLDARLFG